MNQRKPQKKQMKTLCLLTKRLLHLLRKMLLETIAKKRKMPNLEMTGMMNLLFRISRQFRHRILLKKRLLKKLVR